MTDDITDLERLYDQSHALMNTLFLRLHLTGDLDRAVRVYRKAIARDERRWAALQAWNRAHIAAR